MRDFSQLSQKIKNTVQPQGFTVFLVEATGICQKAEFPRADKQTEEIDRHIRTLVTRTHGNA